ncbi:MAG TPA: GNAT family N-acetyltransferase [Dehalococcoidia bacterium]|nr:GNAT family N-acetyltransferase [Dehalococcoidia bacterium]
MSYRVEVEDFDRLRDPWLRLLRHCSTNSIFLTPQWHRVWWHHFGQGWELLLLAVRHDGELVGLAPLRMRGEHLALLGGSDLCDYLDIIASSGYEDVVSQAILDFINSLGWQTFHLFSLPASSPVLTHLVSRARERSLVVQVREEDVCPQLGLPPTWEDYVAGLTPKNRHELKRKLRRLFEEPAIEYYFVGEMANLQQDMEDFFRLFRLSQEGKAEFMTPQRASFFSEMAQVLGADGYLRLYFLELGGVRVAASLGFDYNDTLYLYNSGYDPGYSRLSVGLLLKALCIKDCIRAGKRRFDFLRGGEAYKYDLGGQDIPVYQCLISRC